MIMNIYHYVTYVTYVTYVHDYHQTSDIILTSHGSSYGHAESQARSGEDHAEHVRTEATQWPDQSQKSSVNALPSYT